MKKIIILICVLFILNSFYDNKELNDLAVVTAMNIDKNKNNYKVSLQIINPQNKQDETTDKNKKYIIYEGLGENITTAIDNISKKLSKKIYLTHMNLLIINENIAKNNLKDIINYFIRNNNTRPEFIILINKNNKINPLVNNSSNSIINTFKNNYYQNNNSLTTLNDLISIYKNKNKEITLQSIDTIDNKKSITISSLAIFKNNRFLNYLRDDETTTCNIIMNKINKSLFTINLKNNHYITTEIDKPKTKILINSKNNIITINIKALSSIKETNYKLNLSKKKNIKKIEKIINNEIKKNIKKNIIKINKNYNTDIFGFKDLINKYNPKYFKKNNYNKNYLNKLNIIIKTKINIIEDNYQLGGINNE